MKSIKVSKAGRNFFVKIERATEDGCVGLFVKLFCDEEKSKCVMEHFLDFSGHPANKLEENILKFSNHFSKKTASEWVDGYLKDKR